VGAVALGSRCFFLVAAVRVTDEIGFALAALGLGIH
jgi:hypothetical protein